MPNAVRQTASNPREEETGIFWTSAALIALVLVAVLPMWPWSRGWGWAPAGMIAMGLGALILFSLAVVPEG